MTLKYGNAGTGEHPHPGQAQGQVLAWRALWQRLLSSGQKGQQPQPQAQDTIESGGGALSRTSGQRSRGRTSLEPR